MSIVACLSEVLQQVTKIFMCEPSAVADLDQPLDVLDHAIELERHANPLEFLAVGAVEADLDLVQPGGDEAAARASSNSEPLEKIFTVAMPRPFA